MNASTNIAADWEMTQFLEDQENFLNSTVTV